MLAVGEIIDHGVARVTPARTTNEEKQTRGDVAVKTGYPSAREVRERGL